MSYIHLPDKELFEEGVLLTSEYNEEIRCDLQGLYRLSNSKSILPCIYKKVLSFKNGFARAIDMAGRLIYVSEDGDSLFDCELPFVQELCDDFDEDGKASIGCLVNATYIIKGHMNTDGEMFLKGYNEV